MYIAEALPYRLPFTLEEPPPRHEWSEEELIAELLEADGKPVTPENIALIREN